MSKVLFSSAALLFLMALSISLAGAYTFAEFNERNEIVLGKEVGGQFGQTNAALLKTAPTQSFEYVVVAYVILIVFFSIILSVVRVVPLFEKKLTWSIIVTICIVGLISLSGVIDMAARTVLSLSANPSVDSWSSIALFLVLILFAAVATIINGILAKVRRMAKRDEARDSGFKLGSDVEIAKTYSPLFKK